MLFQYYFNIIPIACFPLQAKSVIRPTGFNVAKQALVGFHTYQSAQHRCKRQESMRLAPKETEKSDDSLVTYRGQFYRITNVDDNTVSLKQIITQPLNTSEHVQLPWGLVGVRRMTGEVLDTELLVGREHIKTKAIQARDIISTLKPEWVIT